MEARPGDDVELRVGVRRILRAGIWASGSLLVAGLLMTLAGAGAGRGALRLGLLVLMCTPLVRVAALAAGYARHRDWPFFWASAGVLALLGVGLLLGTKH